jgi:hypothetical protein
MFFWRLVPLRTLRFELCRVTHLEQFFVSFVVNRFVRRLRYTESNEPLARGLDDR